MTTLSRATACPSTVVHRALRDATLEGHAMSREPCNVPGKEERGDVLFQAQSPYPHTRRHNSLTLRCAKKRGRLPWSGRQNSKLQGPDLPHAVSRAPQAERARASLVGAGS